jgi:hypothetical protein
MTWKPGQSGNPAGRTPTLRNFMADLRKAHIEPHMPEILGKVVEAAKQGDTAAAKLLLDRTYPQMKSVAPTSEVAVDPNAPLAVQAREVVAAMARGEISTDEAAALLSAISHAGKVIESDELAKRIEALEQRSKSA